ncbi:hypothetical protein KM043_012019 [Ampulex compressa]|nr:hypothetical protein KM043_012019 [Ampulex compressa]
MVESIECQAGWSSSNGGCVETCPVGTYGATDGTTRVCATCHYTCLTCSGPSENDCTACHEDAELSRNFGSTHCVLSDLSWSMKSTLWFYRMSMLFALNLAILTTVAVYLATSWCLRRRHSLMYSYSKVSYSNNGVVHKENDGLQSNVCLSDSE